MSMKRTTKHHSLIPYQIFLLCSLMGVASCTRTPTKTAKFGLWIINIASCTCIYYNFVNFWMMPAKAYYQSSAVDLHAEFSLEFCEDIGVG